MTKEKKKDQGCSCVDEACKIQQRIFEREVDEELQQEKLIHFWQKYRFVIIGGIVAVLLATIGYELHRSWWQKIRLQESDQYENALFAAYTGKPEEAVSRLKALSEDGRTGYRYLAQMEAAGILLSSNQTDEGMTLLSALANDDKAPVQLRNAAALAFVGHRLENGDATALQGLLNPMLNSSEGSFAASAAELSALLYVRENQTDKAVQVLESALKNGDMSPQAQQRLSGLLMEIKP